LSYWSWSQPSASGGLADWANLSRGRL